MLGATRLAVPQVRGGWMLAGCRDGGEVDLSSRCRRIAVAGAPGLLWRGEGSREPPTDLGALVGVLTEERDDEAKADDDSIRIRRRRRRASARNARCPWQMRASERPMA